MSELATYTEPDYPGSKYRQWTKAAYDALQKSALCCDVCMAIPNVDGHRDHGRGCYQVDQNGGGSDWFSEDEILAVLAGRLGHMDVGREDNQ